MEVGIDVLETERFIGYGRSRLERIFTSKEMEYFDRFSGKETHICGNFCAKEAFLKALKIGIGGGLSLRDIEVLHMDSGAPYINRENGKVKKLLKDREVEISISHTKKTSVAICIIF